MLTKLSTTVFVMLATLVSSGQAAERIKVRLYVEGAF